MDPARDDRLSAGDENIDQSMENAVFPDRENAVAQKYRGSWLALALVLAACSGTPPPAATPEPPPPTLAPTSTPWTLEVEDAEYTTETRVGRSVFVKVTVKNTGNQANPAVDINFSELDANADIRGCDPECAIEDLPGFGPSAVFPGLKAGKSRVYEIEFVATKVGVVAWKLCVYDDLLGEGESVYCGDGRTTIR